MAVYTPLEQQEVENFVHDYGMGPVLSFEGIAEGIENTNYLVITDESGQVSEDYTEPQRQFVLTVFETLSANQLSFYVELTSQLHQQGLPVPCPVNNADGEAIGYLQHKPALLIPRAKGSHPQQASVSQCQAIGDLLGKLHRYCLGSQLQQPSQRDYDWLQQCGQQLLAGLNDEDQQLLNEELQQLQELLQQHPQLPQAVIHGDLFRDNSLFEGDRLCAVIDFYSAGNGHLLLDLAIVVNDWCSQANGELAPQLTTALLQSYQQQRAITANERPLWNHFLRIAALRFWVSRLEAHQTHRPGGLTDQKDPDQYKQILLARRRQPQQL